MINGYDIAYAVGVGVSAPYWLVNRRRREKVLRAFKQRMGEVPARSATGPAVLIHAVSLGEINATSALVKLLQQARPELHVIVSTTTDTGYDRGKQLYGSTTNVTLVRFPLDFTKAISRLIESLRPSLVVLMELELWPNFLKQCEKRKIPVVLVNGRMTPPAFKRYRLVKLITGGMLRRLAAICAQDESYADRFRQLGAPHVTVTGTMKFDTAQVSDRVEGDEQLASELGLSLTAGGGSPGSLDGETPRRPPAAIKESTKAPLWVCGSTGPGEEAIILDAYHTLLTDFPTLRLAIIPRHPQRFDEVAALIAHRGYPLLRRSLRTASTSPRPIILGDTMGELRKFYSLATVVFIGRSLVDLGPRQHGSDMIEPAALAKPIATGPFTHNFAEPMAKLLAADAIRVVNDAPSLVGAIGDWLANPASAAETGISAQNVVRENQGATARHAEIVLRHLASAGAQK